MTRIYTRSGDNGTTGLGSGERMSKNHIRIAAIGDIDELNSAIGLIRSHPLDAVADSLLQRLQHFLFEVGAELALPDKPRISAQETRFLEHSIDDLSAPLAPLKNFILPGGCPAAAACHMARAICRRAERQLIELHAGSALHSEMNRSINRLSDLLFVLARHINKSQNHSDVYWKASLKNN